MTKRERDIIARYMRELGSAGGRKAAAKMTARQRRNRAVKAAKASAAARKEATRA